MALTATTLTNAITAYDTSFAVAAVTGMTAPNFTTGVGITYLLVETEYMQILTVNTTTLVITVQRGIAGSRAVAHVASTGAVAGLPSDFGPIVPSVTSSQPETPAGKLYGMSAVVASAATIVAPGPIFHVSGGTAINIITPPTGFIEGQVTIIFDSACTWTTSAVTNGIAVSGTCTTAASAVTFYFDVATLRWYPSRLA